MIIQRCETARLFVVVFLLLSSSLMLLSSSAFTFPYSPQPTRTAATIKHATHQQPTAAQSLQQQQQQQWTSSSSTTTTKATKLFGVSKNNNNNDDDNSQQLSNSLSLSRRSVLASIAASFSVWLLQTEVAMAADEPGAAATNPWDAIRFELNDTNASGGVAYLKQCIDTRDFPAIMDFTKEYDLRLRKQAMGAAKKTLLQKAAKETATMINNAVTFDLIGMNRNSRPGQENYDQVVHYFTELQQDIMALLALEGQ